MTLEIKGINFVCHSIMYLLHYYLTIVTTLGFLLHVVPVERCALHPNVFEKSYNFNYALLYLKGKGISGGGGVKVRPFLA